MYKLTAALLTAAMVACSAQADYLLIYDPLNGSLSIDTGGGDLYTYGIFTDPGDGGGFIQENHVQIEGNLFTDAFVSEDNELSDANVLGWIELEEPVNIGNVLPSQLSIDEVRSLITSTIYADQRGTGNPPDFTIRPGGFTIVPEPATLTVLALGGLLFAARRRRDA